MTSLVKRVLKAEEAPLLAQADPMASLDSQGSPEEVEHKLSTSQRAQDLVVEVVSHLQILTRFSSKCLILD